MTVHRIEIHALPDQDDPRGESVRRAADEAGWNSLQNVRTADVYLVEADLGAAQVEQLAAELLTDPVIQEAKVIANGSSQGDEPDAVRIEVHPLPGVMDPVAQSVENTIRQLLGTSARVRTGTMYAFKGITSDDAEAVAVRLLANPVIQAIHTDTVHPDTFPTGHDYDVHVREIPIRDLTDAELESLSQTAHLFLSLEEMQCIREEYRTLGRDPRDVELETLAQTWSEHCVHKTLKSTIHYQGDMPHADGRPGVEHHADGSYTIHNLLKCTVAAATHELIADGVDWTMSVFVDNAGVIRFDEDTAVCFKVETHNHPSAIEPYGGAATGIGGCIRDIIGTGLAAKPIASSDIFCVASLTMPHEDVPTGCLHPKRILNRIVAGVRDYGNRMGIPTVNGSVYFDDRYVGNPLVYCGCVGVMPADKVEGDPQSGDHIIALGGRTGRDGIHGATFSSAELTDAHADEFGHAVQIGNPITEKKLLDVILQARDHETGCLYSAITDCGAGGFSSAVGEMGEKLGADVQLERAPLKYDGLSYTEIWISEAQERMVLSVPASNIETLAELCRVEDVEMCDLGTFGTPGAELILNYNDTEVGRMPMSFLHDGIPTPVRRAEWKPHASTDSDDPGTLDLGSTLMSLLAHPNIASKHVIVRQYDHEVQGGTVIKPLTGEHRDGPADASVVLPKLASTRGLALANGLATGMARDPYRMTLVAIDECVRNLVCVGADPTRIAILDNFCWPSCGKPENLGSLVRAALACYDGAKAFRTPFISGKDSLNNQFTTDDGRTIEIPPTLLISGFGIVKDVRRCITMDAKRAGSRLILVGATSAALGGSHLGMVCDRAFDEVPLLDLDAAPQHAAVVSELIESGRIMSAHDCSEGGLLVAAAEMAFSGRLGLSLDLDAVPVTNDALCDATRAFAESPSRYLLEVSATDADAVLQACQSHGVPCGIIGTFTDDAMLNVGATRVSTDALREAWLGTIHW